MERRSFLIGLAGTIVAPHAAAGAGTASLSLAAELDELIQGAMRRLAAAAGLAVAVYSHEGIYTRAFGVTDVLTGEPVSTDTAFYIASATKSVTAMALANVAARGGLNLDSTLATFAREAPFPAAVHPERVTFRHLLSHTSGIANDPIGYRLAFSGEHDPQLLWRLLGVSSVNTDAPFGTFQYTNTDYNIATILTDRHLGILWQELLDREIFRPAGMRRSTARMSQARSRGWSVAEPHVALPEGVTRIYLEKTDQIMQSAGGVVMSANDAVRWLQLLVNAGAVDGRQVIDGRAVIATRAPLATVNTDFDGYHRNSYGLGWYQAVYRGEAMLHHFGGFAGFRSHLSYIPARGIGVAAFVNDSTAATELTDAIANYIYDRTARRTDARQLFDAKMDSMVAKRDKYFARVQTGRAERRKRPWTLRREQSAYAGSYVNDDFGRIEISAQPRKLEVRYGVMHAIAQPYTDPDSIMVELVPQSEEIIAFAGGPTRLEALVFDGETYRRV